MGGASSKVTRKLPTKPKPTWAGARTPSVGESGAESSVKAKASEFKDESIQRDAADPHFLANLNRLGPVKVDHHMTSIRADPLMENIIRIREASEREALSSVPIRNRIQAAALADILEIRKSIRTEDELGRLANANDMDIDVLERVASTVTTPSIDESTVHKTVNEDGQERTTMLATWVEPPSKAERHRV